jgi:hypothetical protein
VVFPHGSFADKGCEDQSRAGKQKSPYCQTLSKGVIGIARQLNEGPENLDRTKHQEQKSEHFREGDGVEQVRLGSHGFLPGQQAAREQASENWRYKGDLYE